MNELLTIENQRIKRLLETMERTLAMAHRTKENYRPALSGERFMTEAELADKLRVSRRTIREFRLGGTLPYIQLRGKVLFRESDIESVLAKNYYEAVR